MKNLTKQAQVLLDKKADENNTIDLNAYEAGLIDMFNFMMPKLKTSIEMNKRLRSICEEEITEFNIPELNEIIKSVEP